MTRPPASGRRGIVASVAMALLFAGAAGAAPAPSASPFELERAIRDHLLQADSTRIERLERESWLQPDESSWSAPSLGSGMRLSQAVMDSTWSRRLGRLLAAPGALTTVHHCVQCDRCGQRMRLRMVVAQARVPLEIWLYLDERNLTYSGPGVVMRAAAYDAAGDSLIQLLRAALPGDSALARFTSAELPGDAEAARAKKLPPGYYHLPDVSPTMSRIEPPEYPEDARRAGIEGVVQVTALVDRRGEVRRTRVVRSVPGLDHAASQAVERWLFVPATACGEPIECWVTVPVRFRLK